MPDKAIDLILSLAAFLFPTAARLAEAIAKLNDQHRKLADAEADRKDASDRLDPK